jgi:hypothetical protein
MVACLWCRIGCLFLLLLLWCCYLLVDLTAIFLMGGSAFQGVIGIFLVVHWCFSSLNFVVKFFGMRDTCKVTGLLRRNMELGLRIRCRGLILHMWLITAGGGGVCMFLLLDAFMIYLYYRDIEIIKNDLFLLVCNWWRWLLYCDSSYFYFGFEIYSFLT